MSITGVTEVTGDIHVGNRRHRRGDHLLGDGMDMLIVMTGLVHGIGIGAIRPEAAVGSIAVAGSTAAARCGRTGHVDDLLRGQPRRRREGEGVKESVTTCRGRVVAGLGVAGGTIPPLIGRGHVVPPVQGVNGAVAGEVNFTVTVVAAGNRIAVAILTLVGAGVGVAVTLVLGSATP